jgi:hypothetical protein
MQNPIIDLPNDKTEDWEVLYEFIIRGGLYDGPLECTGTGREVLQRCMAFLEYASHHDMSAIACELIYLPMKGVFTAGQIVLEGADIEIVFKHSSWGSAIRVLIAQAACQASGIKSGEMFSKQESEVQGFALEVLKQVRLKVSDTTRCRGGFSYGGFFTGETRYN